MINPLKDVCIRTLIFVLEMKERECEHCQVVVRLRGCADQWKVGIRRPEFTLPELLSIVFS